MFSRDEIRLEALRLLDSSLRGKQFSTVAETAEFFSKQLRSDYPDGTDLLSNIRTGGSYIFKTVLFGMHLRLPIRQRSTSLDYFLRRLEKRKERVYLGRSPNLTERICGLGYRLLARNSLGCLLRRNVRCSTSPLLQQLKLQVSSPFPSL